ncbi:MAG: 4Fe-4S dicluster domain-containing protein [Methanotrichaceae archaeon]|nr:4Fe-4S dicluster domain-containing protein [Methanotrichaceae archaeon]
MIRVDASKCLGCYSCSNVCPNKFITREETEDRRTIHFARCSEECDLCVEFCPAKALTLVPLDLECEEPSVSFELVPCKICGAKYATEPMLQRVEASLPQELQKDTSGLAWIRICPVCRRDLEAERAAKQLVLGRSRKSL